MELYREIIAAILEKEEVHIVFPNLAIDTTAIVELACYRTLQEIKDVIENDNFEDEECFIKIEEIICALETPGIDAGNRHDF